MSSSSQLDQEFERRFAAARKAAYWRNRAEHVRESAAQMPDETSVRMMLGIAQDYDFLAEYEERPRRRCL